MTCEHTDKIKKLVGELKIYIEAKNKLRPSFKDNVKEKVDAIIKEEEKCENVCGKKDDLKASTEALRNFYLKRFDKLDNEFEKYKKDMEEKLNNLTKQVEDLKKEGNRQLKAGQEVSLIK